MFHTCVQFFLKKIKIQVLTCVQRACKTRQEGVFVFRVQMIERVRVCLPNRRRPIAVCLYVYVCPFCASVDGHATRI